MELRCPLPVNNIDMTGTTNDNDISKFLVHFKDSDGPGGSAVVTVSLKQSSTSVPQGATVCHWFSNTHSLAQRVVVNCPHDVQSGAFYHFWVTLRASDDGRIEFWGIDFP